MPRDRFYNLAPERRERLMQVAGQEFADRGYEGASLNAILEKSETGKSSFYYYFDDKADLFATVARFATEEILARVGDPEVEALGIDEFWPWYARFQQEALSLLEEEGWVISLVRSFHRFDVGEPDGPRARVLEWTQVMADRIIAHGQKLGVIRTDLPRPFLVAAAIGLDESVDRWLYTNWDELGGEERQRLFRALSGMVRSILEPDAGPGPHGSEAGVAQGGR